MHDYSPSKRTKPVSGRCSALQDDLKAGSITLTDVEERSASSKISTYRPMSKIPEAKSLNPSLVGRCSSTP